MELIESLRAAMDQLAGALRTREEFLASTSQDLNDPISGIKGNAQLLLRRLANRRELNREDIRDTLEHRGGQPDADGAAFPADACQQTVEARGKLARPELRRATVGSTFASSSFVVTVRPCHPMSVGFGGRTAGP